MADRMGNIMPPRMATKVVSASQASGYDKGARIPLPSSYSNTSTASLRYLTRPSDIIRAMAHVDGVVSTAVLSLVQVAYSGFKVGAWNRITGRFDPEGTMAAMGLMSAMDTLQDYSKGFSTKRSVNSVVTTALKELVIDGAIAGELVLDSTKLPTRIQMVPYSALRMEAKGDGDYYPVQQVRGRDPIPLDIPNFFVSELQKDTDRLYADSLLESAINSAIYFLEFIEDMRRVVRQAGHTRIVAKINTEAVMEEAKRMGKTSESDLAEFMSSVMTTVRELLTSLEPEEALVSFDTVEFEAIKADSDKADYTSLLQSISNLAATSLKSSPSILGLRGQGSQSLSNTESLVFLKNAAALHTPVEEFFSRMLTMATRLFGHDVYVYFIFDPVNLRPADELQSFATQKQANLLDLLSMGVITDAEFAWETGRFPLPEGYRLLSGTGFRSQTSTQAGSTRDNRDKDTPNGAALQPDTPQSAGGRDNASRGQQK